MTVESLVPQEDQVKNPFLYGFVFTFEQNSCVFNLLCSSAGAPGPEGFQGETGAKGQMTKP